MKRRSLILTLLTIIALSGLAIAADPHAPSVPADEALSRLKAGNERFAQSKMSESQPVAARRAATAQAQHPFAIIVGCADSRTSPEIVFDQSIGDLFVVRTAGNLVDDFALGSISTEWSILDLDSSLSSGMNAAAQCKQRSRAAPHPATSKPWSAPFNRPSRPAKR